MQSIRCKKNTVFMKGFLHRGWFGPIFLFGYVRFQPISILESEYSYFLDRVTLFALVSFHGKNWMNAGKLWLADTA